MPCILTHRTSQSPFSVLLSHQIQKDSWRKHRNTWDSKTFSCYGLLSFFCCHMRKCLEWKDSSWALGTVWKCKCWFSCCTFYSNTFRSHRISKSLLLFRPKAEFELQISSEPEIPGCRWICLTSCTLEWKVRLFSLKTALLIILCPRAISASEKWPKNIVGFSLILYRMELERKDQSKKESLNWDPFSFLRSTSL